ncbi:MAG: hypothetical protein OSA04_02835 [Flavobacteriales bacterium]|nr:hypothetical protein [Flavobacteriales bacterium]
MNNNLFVSILISSIFFSCSGDSTVRNGLSLEKRKKVFQELRVSQKKASKEALSNYPKPGTPGGGGVEFRVQLKELQVAYWHEVLDSNHVEHTLGDSIFTEGLKEKWAREARGESQD